MKVLITGANKGIGFGIAEALGKEGCEILVGARSEKRGQEAVEKLISQGITASFIKIDLNDFETIHKAAAEVEELDLLVNNAGIPDAAKEGRPDLDHTKTVFDYTTEDLRTTMEVNFLGTHEMIQTFLPKLAEKGKIVNMSVPIQPNNFWGPLAYQTSKAALNIMMMTYALAFKNAKSQQQIFGILPGAVATDLNGAEVGGLGGFVKSIEDAGKLVAKFALDSQNHNGQMIQFDGKILTDYEVQLRG